MREMRLRKCGFVPSLAAVALLSIGGAARADYVLYQTGFEAPTYTAGSLNGQDGWSDSGGTQVETSTVFAGSQALSVGLSSTDNPTHGLAYDSTTNPAAIVKLQIAFQVQGNQLNQAEGLSVFGDGGFVAQLIDLGGNFSLRGGPGIGAGDVAATTDVWYSLEMDLDFQTQAVTAYLDGTLLGTVAMASTTTSLEEFELGGESGGFAGETVYYDNFSATVVTATPEPSSLALLAIGGLSLTGWRQWKSRRAARSAKS
jgi:hypothetical protein